jgi:hypothetical protein
MVVLREESFWDRYGALNEPCELMITIWFGWRHGAALSITVLCALPETATMTISAPDRASAQSVRVGTAKIPWMMPSAVRVVAL